MILACLSSSLSILDFLTVGLITVAAMDSLALEALCQFWIDHAWAHHDHGGPLADSAPACQLLTSNRGLVAVAASELVSGSVRESVD